MRSGSLGRAGDESSAGGGCASVGGEDDLGHGQLGREDRGAARHDIAGRNAGRLGAWDNEGRVDVHGGDWDRGLDSAGAAADGRGAGDDGRVGGHVSGADALEVSLGGGDLVIAGTVGGQALEDRGDEGRGWAVAVRVRVGGAAGGVEPGVQALREDIWARSGRGRCAWGRGAGQDAGRGG